MKIAVAQINPTVGDIAGNSEKIVSSAKKAKELGADLVVFPEMAITGYPPGDLLHRSSFVDANVAALGDIAKKIPDIASVVGYVDRNPLEEGRPLYDAAAILQNGEIQYVYYKTIIPRYTFFDQRYFFEPAVGVSPVKFADKKVAVTIAEDLWTDDIWGKRHGFNRDLLQDIAKKKVNVVVNIAASPYFAGFERARLEALKKHAIKHKVPVITCNQAGGNGELVFDGSSCAISATGEIIARAKSFEEDLILVDLVYGAGDIHEEDRSEAELVYRALVQGVRDFALKSGYGSAVVDLTGGVDGAVTACLAAEALGKENVTALVTSPDADAEALVSQLGIKAEAISLQGLVGSFASTLRVGEEDAEARLRNAALSAVAQQRNALGLSSVDRSQLMVGAVAGGGYAPLGDVPKTLVYRIAKEVINKEGPVIPEGILNRPEKTAQQLPESGVLDQIIKGHVDESKSADEIAAGGVDRATVDRVTRLIERTEAVRRQAPPIPRVTSDLITGVKTFPLARKV